MAMGRSSLAGREQRAVAWRVRLSGALLKGMMFFVLSVWTASW